MVLYFGLIWLLTKDIILSKIYAYSVAATKDAAFVIGGWDGLSYFDHIAKFNNTEWSLQGYLQKRRRLHGSISMNDQVIVIGGRSESGS